MPTFSTPINLKLQQGRKNAITVDRNMPISDRNGVLRPFFVVDTEKAVPLTLEQDYAKRLIRSAKAH